MLSWNWRRTPFVCWPAIPGTERRTAGGNRRLTRGVPDTTMMRGSVVLLLACALLAQESQPVTPAGGDVIRQTVSVVVTPVTVTDKKGRHIHGLQPHEFRLFD